MDYNTLTERRLAADIKLAKAQEDCRIGSVDRSQGLMWANKSATTTDLIERLLVCSTTPTSFAIWPQTCPLRPKIETLIVSCLQERIIVRIAALTRAQLASISFQQVVLVLILTVAASTRVATARANSTVTTTWTAIAARRRLRDWCYDSDNKQPNGKNLWRQLPQPAPF
jgi:hypothetical protein